MKGTTVIVANGISKDNMRLQPWRYLYEIGLRITSKHRVVFITDGDADSAEESWSEGVTVVYTRFLSVFRQRQLGGLIKAYEPAQVWWSTTPRTLAFWPVLRSLGCPVIALITCPLYSWRELFRASLAGIPFVQLRALWQQRLVPRWLFIRMLESSVFSKVFTQSKSNRNLLLSHGAIDGKVAVLPVGIDKEDRLPVSSTVISDAKSIFGFEDSDCVFLYLGAIRPIRGFDALMEAFPDVVKNEPRVRLVVLARGADDDLCRSIEAQADEKGWGKSLRVIGGWLTREQVWGSIEACDVVILPFVIVPSDVPIAILEALSRGKPVIASPVDGIPELVEGRGIVVDPLDKNKFANAMIHLSLNQDKVTQLGKSARDFMEEYPDWDQVGDIALKEVV